jgi:glycosyltransferase involved in cell wall biosynthesis
MRIAILWIELTGYLNACLRELASRRGVELIVAHRPPGPDSPFASDQFEWLTNQFLWRSLSDLDSLDDWLGAHRPSLIIFAGWAIPAYRKVAKRWSSRAVRVMTMDNCWLGTLPQRLGCLLAPVFVRKLADAIWVPGERQALFASKLHFEKGRILRGLYCCDYAAFSATRECRMQHRLPLRKAFIFVGRFVEEKGVRTLVAAYRAYRTHVRDPWPLICYGEGPLARLLESDPGIIVKGFVQPADLPAEFGDAACLVLPSSFEPWAVVVHEAASAGLSILATTAVGAVPHLVQDNYNGFLFGVGDFAHLSELMERVSSMNEEQLELMSAASASLARQFTPVRWADTVLEYAIKEAGNSERQSGLPSRLTVG